MDADVFFEPLLQFTLRKPGDWRYMPAAWSPVAHMKNVPETAVDWNTYANMPFCVAMGQHDSRRHAVPSLQVTVRPFQRPGNVVAEEILQGQLDMLARLHNDLDMLEATSAATVSGHRANFIRARFQLPIQSPDGVSHIAILSRSYVVFTPGRVFTVGLNSSADPDFYDEAQFAAIAASIRIDA